MRILNDKQIRQKVTRLAYEIIEQNTHEDIVYMAGINNNGYAFAQILLDELEHIPGNKPKFKLFRLILNPASPTDYDIELDIDSTQLVDQSIIVVDDVANTGRTLFYAFKPFLNFLLRNMKVAVLVDRKHKSFPVQVDYVGLSLATTLNDNIDVNLARKDQFHAEIS